MHRNSATWRIILLVLWQRKEKSSKEWWIKKHLFKRLKFCVDAFNNEDPGAKQTYWIFFTNVIMNCTVFNSIFKGWSFLVVKAQTSKVSDTLSLIIEWRDLSMIKSVICPPPKKKNCYHNQLRTSSFSSLCC